MNPITALTITLDAYKAMRGNTRRAALTEIAGWLHMTDAAERTAMSMAQVSEIRFILILAGASESEQIRFLVERITGLLPLVEQAHAGIPTETQAEMPAPVAPALGYILPEDEECAGEATDAEIADSNQPSKLEMELEAERMAEWLGNDPRQEDIAADHRQESIDQTSEWITNAPEAYDGFGTFTTGRPSETERTVRIHHDHLEWQRNRYGSGLFACAPVAQPVEQAVGRDWFAGVNEGTLRVWYAVNRACQGREAGAFFDEIPVAELGRMTIRQIAASLKDLVERGLVCEADAGSAIHRIWISPAMLAVMRQGITMPIPCAGDVSPEKIRQPRQPKQPGEASNAGGCYLRVSAQGISHKCLNRSVAVAVLAYLEQQGIDYQTITITGRFTIDQMMESARKLVQEAGATPLQMPQPSGGYRPSKSKTVNA